MSDYYSRKYIFWDIYKNVKNREIAILPLLRGGQIRNEAELETLLKLTNWGKKKLNLYISCAKLTEIPDFTFKLSERSSQTGPWFKDKFDKLMYEYDLFLDFDSDNPSEALRDALKVKDVFDDYNLPYHILFSGNRGVHLIIDGKYISFRLENGFVEPHKTIIENIKEAFDLKTLDLAHCGVPNKLRKVPFSLVLPKKFSENAEFTSEQLMNVVLPLSDEKLKNFEVLDFMLRNVIIKEKLMNAPIIERFGELDELTKRENVKEFIKNFAFKKEEENAE